MSLLAMVWVKKHAPVENTTEMCLLYALADRTDDDGTGAWPSYATLADETRTSRRTVIRHMQELERRGLIERGDQSLLDKKGYPRDRRPVVWDLNLALRRTPPLQDAAPGCQNDTPEERGANGGTTGCQPVHNGVPAGAERGATVGTQTIHKPSLNHPEPTNTHAAAAAQDGDLFAAAGTPATAPQPQQPDLDAEFDQWWQGVPRKKSKGDARKAFRTARKRVPLQVLLDGLAASVAQWQREGRPADKVPYPATWLRSEGWEDQPDEWQQQVPQQPVQAPNPWAAYLDDQPAYAQEPRPDYAQGHTIIDDDWS